MSVNYDDSATIYFRTTPEAEKELISRASRFPYVVIADAYLVNKGEAEPVKAVTVVSKRVNRRTEFDTFVLGAVELLGKAGAQSVFAIINGMPASFNAGEDYESVRVNTANATPSVGV